MPLSLHISCCIGVSSHTSVLVIGIGRGLKILLSLHYSASASPRLISRPISSLLYLRIRSIQDDVTKTPSNLKVMSFVLRLTTYSGDLQNSPKSILDFRRTVKTESLKVKP